MSIKLINHRRRLLHKHFYKPPHKRHTKDKMLLTKAEKIRLNKEKKLSAKNRSKRNKPKKKPKRDGLKLPYRFKYYQFRDYKFKNNSLNKIVLNEEE